MLANEINASGRHVDVARLAIKVFDEPASYFFNVHVSNILKVFLIRCCYKNSSLFWEFSLAIFLVDGLCLKAAILAIVNV